MIKERNLFVELNQSFSETVENANKTETKVSGKGRVEFFCDRFSRKFVQNFNELLFLCARKLRKFSVSKLTGGGAKVVFGEKLSIEQGNGTVYPLSERGSLFIWKIIGFRNHKKNKC